MGKEEAKNCSMGTKKPRRTLLCRAQGGGGRFGRLGQPRGLGQWSLSRGRPPKGCSHYQFGVYLCYNISFSMSQAQKQQLFTGRYKDFIVTLRIEPGEDFLAVFVQDPSTTEVFIQEVTAKFLQSSQTLSGFKSYVELYEFLTNNFAQVAFVSNALKFEYNGKTAFVDLVLKVRSNFPEGLNPSDNAQIAAELAAQKKALQEKLKAIEQAHSAQIAKLQSRITQANEEARKFKEQTAKKQQQFLDSIKKLEQELESIQVQVQPPFFHNPGNSDMFFYTVATTSQTTAKLIRQVEDYKVHNFVNGVEIPTGKNLKYTVIARESTTRSIMVGVCTSSGFGRLNNHENPESAYYSYDGWLNVGGKATNLKQVDPNNESSIGDVINLEVNWGAKAIRWWKDGAQLIQATIPQELVGKKLYLSILLLNVEAVLDLSV